MASSIWSGAYSSLFLGHSASLTPSLHGSLSGNGRRICRVRQLENRSRRCLHRTCSCPTCRTRNGKPDLEKALTISEADQFTRRGGHYRLHAIFVNQLFTFWGYQEELSSMPGMAAYRMDQNQKGNSRAHRRLVTSLDYYVPRGDGNVRSFV
jgi:hypothetical protein